MSASSSNSCSSPSDEQVFPVPPSVVPNQEYHCPRISEEVFFERAARPDCLIFDVRSFFLFEACHHVRALNIALPRAIAKKGIEVTAEKVRKLLSNAESKALFDSRADFGEALLYIGGGCGRSAMDNLARFLEAEGLEVNGIEMDVRDVVHRYPDEFVHREHEADVAIAADSPRTIELRQLFQGEPPSQVYDWLFLGDGRTANRLAGLQNLGVTSVVNAAKEHPNYFEKEGISYCHLHLADDPDAADVIEQMLEASLFIARAKGRGHKLLVHCHAGISRSATVVLTYLMRFENMTLKDAMNFLKDKRDEIAPNPGFIEALCRLDFAFNGHFSVEGEFDGAYDPFVMNIRGETA